MPALASNFTANSLSGTVRVSAGTANIRLAVEPIAFEGTKQFVVKIRKDSIEGAVIATSSSITIVDTSSIVSMTANTATVLEGNLVSFTISTANVPNNANVYFSILPVTANITSHDFEANIGRFTIVNNSATFALKANADLSLMDETGETFKLQVRTASPAGNIVFTTSNIAISDTSKAFNIIGVTAGNASPIVNGKSEIFTFIATNIPNGTLFYYNTTGNVASFTSNTGSFALNGTSNVFAITNPQLFGTANAFYNVVVRSDSATGNIVATSNTMAVNYVPPKYYLWGWGNGSSGALGLDSSGQFSSPQQVGALTDWLTIDAGRQHRIAIKTDGTMWSWGSNYAGRLGLGDTITRSSPTQIGTSTWLKVSAGGYHNLAITTGGTLWGWGLNRLNDSTALGLGDGSDRSAPTQIGALTTWASIAAAHSSHCLAIKTDGTMWSWGNNSYGQLGLGDPTTTHKSSPVQVGALTTWSKVTGGARFSLAIKTDGTLWSWGRNAYNSAGCLGLGNTTNRSSPNQVGGDNQWLSIAAGVYHVVSTSTYGLYAWGKNGQGRLGLGDTTDRLNPSQVNALTWSTVSAGDAHSLAIKSDGTMWAWGHNEYGKLGDGTTINRSSPVQVGARTTWTSIAADTPCSMAIVQE